MSISAYGSITVTDLLDTATYIYYAATNSTTYSDWHTSPQTTDKYIGIYSGPPVDGGQPANPTSAIYSAMDISKYVGEDGAPGSQGPEGPQGPKGDPGKMLYGTCNTTASTAAKVVVCSDATQLYDGLIISVKCTTANTAAAPTLNVNNLGAKAVFFNNAVTATANAFKWASNSTIQFMYDSSLNSSAGAWIPVGYPLSYYGTASTAEGTAAKVSTITGAVICKGTIVSILFSARNTANVPTLNISSIGAINIYYNDAAASSTNFLTWEPNTVVNFMFDGRYWRYQGARNKYFGMNSTVGAYVASGISNTTFAEKDLSTYGYNITMGAYNSENAFRIGYNGNYTMKLSGSNLSFFRVTSVDSNGNITAVSSNPSMVLNSNGLAFYDGGGTATGNVLAEFTSSGYIKNGSYSGPVVKPTEANHFATSGMRIGLNEGYLISPNFSFDGVSQAWFKGSIAADSGTIGGWTITSSYLASARTFQDTQTDETFIFLSNGLSETELQVLDVTSENWSIKIGNTFGILEDGTAYIGQSDLRSGKIGPFSFSNNGLSYTVTTLYIYYSVTNSSILTDWHITRTSNDKYVGLYGGEPIDGGQPTNPSADMLSQMTILKYASEENYQIVSSISVGQDGISFGGNDNIYISATGDMYIGAEAGSQAIDVNPTLNYLDYDVTEQKITFFFDNGKINSLNVVNETVENSNINILNVNTANVTSLHLGALGQEIEVGQFINQLNNNIIALSDYLNRDFYLKAEIDTKVNNLTTLINTTATNIIDTYTLPQIASFLHFSGNDMYIGKTGTSLMNFSTSLLEVVSTSLGVTGSLFFQSNDNTKVWAYRRGSEVISGKPNLNDVWIGG